MKLRFVPKRLRKNTKTVDDDCTVGVSETVCSSECESTTPISRRVCFDEEENVYHECDFDQEEIDLWFTKEDYASFNKQNKTNIKRLRAEEEANSEDPTYWSRALCRLYWAFQDAKSAKDLQGILDNTKITLDEEVVGLEHLAIKTISRDSSARKEDVLDEVMTLQNAHYESASERADAIASFMKSKCRPSRIYAMYVAHVAAGMR